MTHYVTESVSSKNVSKIMQNIFEHTKTISINSHNLNMNQGNIMKYNKRADNIQNKFGIINIKEFKNMLTLKALNNIIIITLVDISFAEMGLNLYLTSFVKFNISNYIFVCLCENTAAFLNSKGITAISLWNDASSTNPSNFGTESFGQKAIKKVIVSGLALSLGYHVLFTDVDIVFLKDPLPYLTCDTCDVIFQVETPTGIINSGFYLAFSTLKAINLHFTIIERRNCWKFRQQPCFIAILKELNVSIKLLPYQLFPSGKVFFDNGKRMFSTDNPCKECVLVHNNWIVSYSNKKYRFKEQLLWLVDLDGYYSNKTAKYIYYENVVNFGIETNEMERNALKTAFILGHLLDRIVILPRFYCYGCSTEHCQMKERNRANCAAHVHFNMFMFDTLLPNRYREHVFLQHYLVPQNVKTSISEVILFNNTKYLNISRDKIKNYFSFPINNTNIGVTKEMFLTWMSSYNNYSVVRFHSLYGTIIDYHDETFLKNLDRMLSAKKLF